MTEPKEQTPAQKLIGDFAPKLVELTDDVLFGDVWARAELSPRDRSLITVAALIAGGNTEQLPGHLNRARENGLSETELVEVITHLAFYAGGPESESSLGGFVESDRSTKAGDASADRPCLATGPKAVDCSHPRHHEVTPVRGKPRSS